MFKTFIITLLLSSTILINPSQAKKESFEEEVCLTSTHLLLSMGSQLNELKITSSETKTLANKIVLKLKFNYYDTRGQRQFRNLTTSCNLDGESRLMEELESMTQ